MVDGALIMPLFEKNKDLASLRGEKTWCNFNGLGIEIEPSSTDEKPKLSWT